MTINWDRGMGEGNQKEEEVQVGGKGDEKRRLGVGGIGSKDKR